MGNLGELHQLVVSLAGWKMVFNIEPIVMSWIVIAALLAFGIFAVRKRDLIPRRIQIIGELIVGQIYQLTEDAMDKEKADKFAPLVVALFLFLVLSNWLGIIPMLDEPTKDLNTPLSLGIMGFVIAHYVGISS